MWSGSAGAPPVTTTAVARWRWRSVRYVSSFSGEPPVLQTTASFSPPARPDPVSPMALCAAPAMIPKKGSAMSLTRMPTRSEVAAARALAGPFRT